MTGRLRELSFLRKRYSRLVQSGFQLDLTAGEKEENAIYIDIQYPKEFNHLSLYKGSVALDGTSLTIFGTSHHQLTVSIIPHTAKESVLGMKKVGDKVNIEFDMIGKYVFSFFERKDSHNPKDRISADFLKENGFL